MGERQMKIALATSSYAPYVGGVEEHVRNVARTLSERGDEVVVWTVARDGIATVREVDGIEVRDLPAPLPARSAGDVARFLLRLPRAAFAWRRAARAFRPDVIHVHCFGPNGTYARHVARSTRTPMIVTTHGETVADDHGVFVRSRFARASLRASLSAAAAVTGCSRVVLDDLAARFGFERGSGVVVFNGIDPNEPIGDLPDGVAGRYVAAVGRLERVKGFDLLIDAFARASLPEDVSLVIGGGGPLADELQEQADAAGIGSRVRIVGALDRPTMAALRSGAIIGVMPSRFEAFGIAALEVWRAGSALVATTHGGPPEFVRDGEDGVLVDAEDVEALAAALRTLIENPALVQRLGAAGFARLPEFSWAHATDSYQALYRAVVR